MTRRFVALALAGTLIAACGGKKDTPKDPNPAPVKAEPAGTKGAEGPTAGDKEVVKAPDKATPEAPKRITGPVAKVNGAEIAAEEFYAERDKITARGAKIPADRLARIEHNILKRLIEKQLISQAVKDAGVAVTAADIEAGFAEYKKRFQNEEQFQNYLKHGRVTKESIEERIRDRRALELLLDKRGDMAVTEEAAQEFYTKNERFYTEKAGVRASHVLIKVPQNADKDAEAKALEKVAEAQALLKKGEGFDAVAKKLSEGPSAPKGGDLGFFGQGRMVKEFEEAAFAMKVGEVSDKPVRSRFGFHIIKVTDKREDRKKTFDEVKDQIIKSLKNKKFFTERRKLVSELNKDAKIEKFLPDPPPAAPKQPGDGHGHGPGDGHGHGPGDGHGHGKAVRAVPVPPPTPPTTPAAGKVNVDAPSAPNTDDN